MNCDINAEAPRPRPLSGGIWTLFSWLRRDERSFSNESLSSAGSDRTAVSFAFLEPLNYKAATKPIVLPPLSPPTDSYRKRVRDRNFQRQRERDITLHRKYGLFKGENSDRFEAFSLPSSHRNSSGEKTERGRRAASESFQRRAPYVPGKRRAPLPPLVTSSLPRSFSRKRPAPQPPINFTQISKENNNSRPESMNSKSESDRRSFFNDNVAVNNKADQHVKQDKIKSDKSFLKQIFDNRKRNSAIETTCIKLLPNISELDKQAAQIIENKKLKVLEADASISTNGKVALDVEGTWICPVCFKKYKNSISSCLYCINQNKKSESDKKSLKILSNVPSNIYTQTDKGLTNVASTSKLCENEEKKKLKEMLKEMKDSLPKRPKHNLLSSNESPTLRIGSLSSAHKNKSESSSKIINEIILNNSENLKTQSKIEKPTTVLTSNRIVNSTISNSNIVQPSSSSTSDNNPFKTTVIELQNKNKAQDCNLAQPNIQNIQVRNINLDKKEVVNSQISTSVQINNIPLIKSESENKNNNKDLELRPKDELKNEVKFNDKINNRTELIQVSSNNKTTINSETKKSDFFNTKISKPLQHKALISEKSASANVRAENGDTNITKITVSLANSSFSTSNVESNNISTQKIISDQSILNNNEIKIQPNNHKPIDVGNMSNLNTPLKISSLLNPVYRPMQSSYTQSETQKNGIIDTKATNLQQKATVSLHQKLMPIKEISEINENPDEKRMKTPSPVSKDYSTNMSVCKVLGVTPSSSKDPGNKALSKLDHHSRRRELVNQLEKSIAKGDEQAAADAAIKLAKLRLSCSVLSFSSQIIGNLPDAPKIFENLPKPSEKDIDKIITKESQVSKKNVNQAQDKIFCKNTIKISSVENDQRNVVSSDGNEKQETETTSKGEKPTYPEDKILKGTIVTPTDVKIGPSTSKGDNFKNGIKSIQIWIEDKEATRGPLFLRIPREATMGQLRRQAETTLGLDSRLQRWIVGRTLCLDVTTPLVSLAGPDLSAPFYLCLVESETKEEARGGEANDQTTQKDAETLPNSKTGEVYNELMKLEQQAIVPNTETFECGVCMDECEPGRGAVLRDCIHSFCRECLSDVVRHCEDPIVSCPAMGCPGVLQEREIRVLLTTEEYERWLARGLATAECGTRNAFHCRTRDCTGWALCEPGVRKFPCPVCKCNNCVPCQAIHDGETCEQYQTKLRTAVTAAQANETDEGTRALLNSLIRRGEALECPECHAIITKKWGCDWVKCSACKTEICWVTRGRRWGPAGRGDTSAGCRCGVDGKRCHPSCGNSTDNSLPESIRRAPNKAAFKKLVKSRYREDDMSN